ncbi:MAG: hypothetical protein ACR2P7_06970, partial [bacterium]
MIASFGNVGRISVGRNRFGNALAMSLARLLVAFRTSVMRDARYQRGGASRCSITAYIIRIVINWINRINHVSRRMRRVALRVGRPVIPQT